MNIRNTYFDLRSLRDDKTILKNPHKGWYYHYVDNSMKSPIYRDGITKDEDLVNFPGLNHLYLRFDWGDIEEKEGVFDWSPIDEIIERWSKYGFTFSLRACTFEGSKKAQYATPKWLLEKEGVGRWLEEKGVYEPYYNNELYLEKLEIFMQEYAKKFNGNPLIEFIDIGTFGTWGEGHTAHGSCTKYDLETMLTHVNLHVKYFPDTQIVINDDNIRHIGAEGSAEFDALKEYCVVHNIGIRDDGICVEYYVNTFNYDTLCNREIYEAFTENAPCDIELAHYTQIKEGHFKDGFPYLESLKTSKATYTGFHGHLSPWLDDNRSFTEYVANRLGYWYFISGIEMPACVTGAKCIAKVKIGNEGFAKAYHRYDLKLYAIAADGTEYELNQESPDNRKWENGGKYTESIKLDFKGVPAGKYSLAVAMNYGERKVQLGLKQECKTADGKYIVGEFDVTPAYLMHNK